MRFVYENECSCSVYDVLVWYLTKWRYDSALRGNVKGFINVRGFWMAGDLIMANDKVKEKKTALNQYFFFKWLKKLTFWTEKKNKNFFKNDIFIKNGTAIKIMEFLF